MLFYQKIYIYIYIIIFTSQLRNIKSHESIDMLILFRIFVEFSKYLLDSQNFFFFLLLFLNIKVHILIIKFIN